MYQLQFLRIHLIAVHDEARGARRLYAQHIRRLIRQNGEPVQFGGGVVGGGEQCQPHRQPCGLNAQFG